MLNFKFKTLFKKLNQLREKKSIKAYPIIKYNKNFKSIRIYLSN